MPEPADQLTPPLRTWRPMAAWTGAILLALGLAWFLASETVVLYRAHAILCQKASLSPEESLRRLGGPERAARTLTLYLRLPGWWANQREMAVYLLGRCGKAAVPALIRALSDPSPYVQVAAASTLSNLAGESSAVVPALLESLGDPAPELRAVAAHALGAVGRGQPAVVPALIRTLDDPEPRVRYFAAAGLGRLGQEAAGAVPALLAKLTDPEGEVRKMAVVALGQIGPGAKAAVPQLMAHFRRECAAEVATALSAIGPDARAAVPMLEEAVRTGTPPGWEIAAALRVLKATAEEAPK
jgi:HEAT repeat protein